MIVTVGNSFSHVAGIGATVLAKLRNYVAQKSFGYGIHAVPQSAKLYPGNKIVFVKDLKGKNCPVYTRKGQWPNTVATAQKLHRAGRLVFRGNWYSLQRYVDAKGNFPTGLLPYVEKFAAERSIPVTAISTRIRPQTRLFGSGTLFQGALPFPPYPEQIAAAEAAWKAERGVIVAPTGFGKSMVVAQLCDKFQVPTLVVVPNLALKAQLTETLRDWFGPNRVGPLSYKLSQVRPDALISIENVDALKPGPTPGVDMVIVDEWQHAAAKTYRDLNRKSWDKVYFKFGLTATPFRSNDEERFLLEGVLSQVIYRVTYEEAVAKGYICPVEAYYYDLPEQEMKGNENNWASVYKELIVGNAIRNQLISDLLYNLAGAKAPTLCLVKEVGHGRKLAEASDLLFACGEDQNASEQLRLFNAGALHSLIGTTGVLGEGVDTKRAEYAILAAGGKAKVQFMQQVGRVLRAYPGKESGKVILFRDSSNKFLLDHFNQCVRYLEEEYGVKIIKLELPQ